MKKCNKCGETKEFSEFNKCKRFNDGHQYTCRLCQKKHYNSNREHSLAVSKAYYETNKKKVLKRTNKYKAKNKDKVKQTYKNYYENTKEEHFARSAKQRALKKSRIPCFTDAVEKERVVNIYKLCQLMTVVTGVEHHVDHMWPLADGGPHWSGNLQIIPAEENIKKRAKVDPAIKATIQEMLAEEVRLHAEH